jgi:hypothetical protein
MHTLTIAHLEDYRRSVEKEVNWNIDHLYSTLVDVEKAKVAVEGSKEKLRQVEASLTALRRFA